MTSILELAISTGPFEKSEDLTTISMGQGFHK